MLSALLLLTLVSIALPARAQISDATCPSSLSYLDNSLHQDPCVVLSTIFGACTNTNPFTLTALGDQYAGYAGPTVQNDPSAYLYQRCLCSMPVYNLVMACETCQQKNVIGWTVWTASCNSSFTGAQGYPILELPIQVPSSTEFASWVNIDNSEQNWSTAEAEAAAASATPSSVSSSSAASSSSPTSTSSGLVSSSSSSSATSGTSADLAATASGSSGGGGHQDNTGAIVGGTVGGIALLGVIGLGALYILKNSNSSRRSAYSRSIDAYSGQQSPKPHQQPASPFHPGVESSAGSVHQAPSAAWYGAARGPPSMAGAQSIHYAPFPSQTPQIGRQYSGHDDPGMWGRPTPAPSQQYQPAPPSNGGSPSPGASSPYGGAMWGDRGQHESMYQGHAEPQV